jgi:predicted acylesterase/phospholipase RssA
MASTSGQTPTTKEHERGLKLLVLDGGGMRGVGTLAILRKIKEETGLDVGDFDMIGGTSAGGLIALGALVGLDLDTIEQLFVESGRKVFTSSWANTAHYHSKRLLSMVGGGPAGGKYRTDTWRDELSSALRRHVDPDVTLRDLGRNSDRPKVFAVASDISTAPSVKPYVMRSYEYLDATYDKTMYEQPYQSTSRMPLLTAAISTSAAPIYFDTHVAWKVGPEAGEVYLVDGGVGFNNPVFLAIQELKRAFGWGAKVGLVVSIGTGLPTIEVTERAKSVLDWGATVVNLATEGHFIHNNFQLVRPVLAGFETATYARFNPPNLGDLPMDDASEKALKKIKTRTRTYLEEDKYARGKINTIKLVQQQEQRPPSASSSSQASH